MPQCRAWSTGGSKRFAGATVGSADATATILEFQVDERVREAMDAYQRREKKLEQDLDALRLDELEHVL